MDASVCYNILTYFLIYSCLGWIAEVVYHTAIYGNIENRGMLNGPVCPIYGIGVVGCFVISDAVEKAFTHGEITDGRYLNGVFVFVGGSILASLLELFTGYFLEKIFHMRWWDYTGKPFNIGGYICLEFSIIWGWVAVLVVKILHPDMRMVIMPALNFSFGWIVLLIIYIIYAVDFVSTIITIRRLDESLVELNRIQAGLKRLSGGMSNRIGKDTLRNMRYIDESRLQASLAKAEMKDAAELKREELEHRAAEIRAGLNSHRIISTGRMLRAFPNLHSVRDLDSDEGE